MLTSKPKLWNHIAENLEPSSSEASGNGCSECSQASASAHGQGWLTRQTLHMTDIL